MSKICIIPPTELPVPLELARKNLRVDDTDMDDLITMWIQGITSALEHEIGQCLMPQTWLVSLDAFPLGSYECIGRRHVDALANAIRLPHPVLDVDNVSYVDADGAVQTLDPGAYVIHRARYHTALVPTVGLTWPAIQSGSQVEITVRCGFGETLDSVPTNAKLYILAKLVEQYDPITKSEVETVQSKFIGQLLSSLKTYE